VVRPGVRLSVGKVVLVAAQQAASVSDNKKMTKPKIQGAPRQGLWEST